MRQSLVDKLIKRAGTPPGITIIGIHGPMESGKTHVADLLGLIYTRANIKVQRLSFATPVKDLARELGWDGMKDAKGRKFLQTLGTDIGRAYDKNLWVGKLADTVTAPVIIVDDIRFENELAWVKELGGTTVRLRHPAFTDRWWRHKFKRRHASEQPIEAKYDFDITNTRDNQCIHSLLLWAVDDAVKVRAVIDDKAKRAYR